MSATLAHLMCYHVQCV